MLLLAGPGTLAAQDGHDCRRLLLQQLGWRFEAADVAEVQIHAGTPCDRPDLAAAQAAGDLVVRVPRSMDAAADARLDASLLQHPATHCAYGYRLGAATRRAVDQLVENRGYRFSALQLGWIGFGAGGSARDGWEPIASFGRGYQPRAGNYRAIAAFYDGQMRSECGVGRQVAQYATQAELYGPEGFDAAFDADEIVIGTFVRLHQTRSILLGSGAGRYSRDGRAVAAARAGRQAFMGLPGFITHVLDRDTLDDLNNQAENFVVYDLDDAAAAALRRHGGFEYYNQRSRAIWSLSRQLPGRKTHGYYQRLLIEQEPGLWAALSADERATVERMQALLADPFYRGFDIYVHKQAVKPVGFHLVRLLDLNPRTPFRIELALHNLHTTLYDRYVAYAVGDCGGGGRQWQAARTPASPGSD